MNPSSMYSKLASTATTTALAALAASALFFATSSQARPMYVNDGAFIQAGPQLVVSAPQLVITPPQLAINAVVVAPAPPVYVHPVRSAHIRPVVVYPPAYPVTYPVNYRVDRVYYIHGRAYLNGHPYRAHYRHHDYDRHHDRHHGRHHNRHHGRHDQGRHAGWNR